MSLGTVIGIMLIGTYKSEQRYLLKRGIKYS
jgi:hypothetical protein